jgi:hypothetical protein
MCVLVWGVYRFNNKSLPSFTESRGPVVNTPDSFSDVPCSNLGPETKA